jgi:hypothetical protein
MVAWIAFLSNIHGLKVVAAQSCKTRLLVVREIAKGGEASIGGIQERSYKI